jgi:hypothetical protein
LKRTEELQDEMSVGTGRSSDYFDFARKDKPREAEQDDQKREREREREDDKSDPEAN